MTAGLFWFLVGAGTATWWMKQKQPAHQERRWAGPPNRESECQRRIWWSWHPPATTTETPIKTKTSTCCITTTSTVTKGNTVTVSLPLVTISKAVATEIIAEPTTVTQTPTVTTTLSAVTVTPTQYRGPASARYPHESQWTFPQAPFEGQEFVNSPITSAEICQNVCYNTIDCIAWFFTNDSPIYPWRFCTIRLVTDETPIEGGTGSETTDRCTRGYAQHASTPLYAIRPATSPSNIYIGGSGPCGYRYLLEAGTNQEFDPTEPPPPVVYNGRIYPSNPGTGVCAGSAGSSGADVVVNLGENFFDTYPGANSSFPTQNPICGKTIRITNSASGAYIDATVVGKCAGCPDSVLQLSTSAYPTIGSSSATFHFVTWQFGE